MITLDWETEAISSRPDYPPRPVGLAVEFPDQRRREYVSFGHPGSPDSVEDAARLVRDSFAGKYGRVLFHNATFDIDVAQTWFNVGWPKNGFDDTLYLAFLSNPHAKSLSLKPMAEDLLGMKPDERDLLYEWMVSEDAPLDVRKAVKRSPSKAGAFISRAPHKVVAPYAIGDVERTRAIYEKLYPDVRDRGMVAAYQVELDVTRVTLDMERGGVRADVRGLKKLEKALLAVVRDADEALCKRLGATINVGSGTELAFALKNAGMLTEETFTATGKQSTAGSVLLATCSDSKVVELLSLRGVAAKYASTFVGPWIVAAEKTGGYILPRFHQVRSMEGGARSGRYSSSDPNFQNIPANSTDSRHSETLSTLASALRNYGIARFKGLRYYLLPDEGCMWAAIDYSQQELRIAAHYENGELAAAYRKDPDMDVHSTIKQKIQDASGIDFPRKAVKTLVFGVLYGMGLSMLAEATGLSADDAKKLRDSFYKALPGMKALGYQCAEEGNSKAGMRTIGGRVYHTESAILDSHNEPVREFGYKMLNYRIQGSAADYTKKGMLNVSDLRVGRIAVQVHDELGNMVTSRKDAERIGEAMCAQELRVPMRVDIKVSDKSWGAVK